jgi:predicted DNA-binding transcriptional regulator AlpA
VNLAELFDQLERRVAQAEREGATAPVANVYRLVLEELRPLAAENGGQPTPQEDRLLDAREVAQRIGCSVRYVYEHADTFPFTRRLSSRVVRFSQLGLERWLARPR